MAGVGLTSCSEGSIAGAGGDLFASSSTSLGSVGSTGGVDGDLSASPSTASASSSVVFLTSVLAARTSGAIRCISYVFNVNK